MPGVYLPTVYLPFSLYSFLSGTRGGEKEYFSNFLFFSRCPLLLPLATARESVAHGVARPASESVAPRLRLRCSGRAAMAYTFKDDGGRMTYYREYNKEVLDKNDTLVGNWVEERALREQIGTGRYALWVNTGDEKSVATNKQQTFTKFTTRPDALDTFSRTLAHSDHTPSAEYPQAG